MKQHFVLMAAFMFCNASSVIAADYAVGADLSNLKQAEDRGFVFKDNNAAKPGLQIFKDHGYNWIRLRLFHTPTMAQNLQYTITMAQAAKKLGYKFLLNYHYSDTWADPGHQVIPKAWEGMTHPQMVEALFNYTRETTTAFREAGVLPDMVQIGNEITNGMLWPDAKLPENWGNFIDFQKAGIAGVEAGKANLPRPRIMVHIDKGGDKVATKAFFDKLESYHVQYDVIGQSYYPWWHGTLNDLRENLIFMANTYNKDIIVVEAAYNWAPAEYRDSPAPFPESPEGQKVFLEEVNRAVMATPNGRGIGIFYWEPGVAPRSREGRAGGRGFFDQDGNAHPVITVFDKFTRGRPEKRVVTPE
ncbi:MAG: arabinogalactan endo-1,4-beta-galactosidase [Acidobacteria bacterium]|nr:MAG: arabinogalactan endo-1,4-beta-galactosidase [Acidobacteriota bacterium]